MDNTVTHTTDNNIKLFMVIFDVEKLFPANPNIVATEPKPRLKSDLANTSIETNLNPINRNNIVKTPIAINCFFVIKNLSINKMNKQKIHSG